MKKPLLPAPAPDISQRKVIKHADWMAEGTRLFGPRTSAWRFKCVMCGHVQTAKDFVDAGVTPESAAAKVYYSCFGRVVKGQGCDWSLGGLFQFHKVEVEMPDGSKTKAFEFAEPLPTEAP